MIGDANKKKKPEKNRVERSSTTGQIALENIKICREAIARRGGEYPWKKRRMKRIVWEMARTRKPKINGAKFQKNVPRAKSRVSKKSIWDDAQGNCEEKAGGRMTVTGIVFGGNTLQVPIFGKISSIKFYSREEIINTKGVYAHAGGDMKR